MSSDESLLTQIGILHDAFKNIQLRHPNTDSLDDSLDDVDISGMKQDISGMKQDISGHDFAISELSGNIIAAVATAAAATAEVNVQPDWKGVGKENGEILNKPTNTDIQNLSRASITCTTTAPTPGNTNLGNITYDETSGTITYSSVTENDIQTSFTAGSNINISSGEISADLSNLSSVYHPKITSSSRLNANLIGDNSSVSNDEYKQLANINTNQTIQDQLDLKQAQITSSSRLNANLIGDNSSVSNDEYKQLANINTNQTIQDQLDLKQASGSYQVALESPVTAPAASGSGSLTLGNGAGFNTKLTYTPPDLSSFITAGAPSTCLRNASNAIVTFINIRPDVPGTGIQIHDMNDETETYFWNGTGDGTYLVNTNSNSTNLFEAEKSGWYSISCILHCTNGTANERSMVYGYVEKQNASGIELQQKYLGSSYYRDDSSNVDDIVVCGDVNLYLQDGEKFRIMTKRVYSQDAGDDNPPDSSKSRLYVEYMFT